MKHTIFIAGGGTGGHIYPGIAIAEALVKANPQIEVRFIGTAEGLEVKIMGKENWPLHLLPIGKLNFRGQYFKKLKTLALMPLAILMSIRLILKYKPKFILGVGGYASGPFVLVGALMGVPTAIWEPNALPGLANRLLSAWVDQAYTVFETAKKFLKTKNIFVFGMPVRSQIENFKSSGSQKDQFQLLCFGGSQGARAINKILFEAVEKYHDQWSSSLKVVHQVGQWDVQESKQRYQQFNHWVESHEFIFEMPKYYQASSIALCRAGASTLAEVAAFGVVPIMVPLPLADSHQVANAQEIVDAKAGILVLQKDLTSERLFFEIEKLRRDANLLGQMSSNLKALHKPGAANRIAQNILESMK